VFTDSYFKLEKSLGKILCMKDAKISLILLVVMIVVELFS